jgi:hypothetical protein
MKYIPIRSWLFDMVPDVECLRFVWFCFLTKSRLFPEDIEYVKEDVIFGGNTLLETLTSDNFENRLFARRFIIKKREGKKHGWLYADKVLVTPKSPEDFIEWLKKHEVPFIGKQA